MHLRHIVAAALIAAFLLPLAISASGPTVETTLGATQFQKLADAMFKVPEVQQVFLPGTTIEFQLIDHGGAAYGGPIASDGTVKVASLAVAGGSDHVITLSRDTGLAIVNAYDQPNTAKLMLKDHLIGLRSNSLKAKMAFGLIARTSADARLATHDPTAGDSVSVGACSGSLTTSGAADVAFNLTLCGSTYAVNKYGAITGMFQPPQLAPRPSITPGFGHGTPLSSGSPMGTPCTTVIGGTCTVSFSVSGSWTKTG